MDRTMNSEENEDLKAMIQKGIDELDAGEGIDAAVVVAKLRERLKELRTAEG